MGGGFVKWFHWIIHCHDFEIVSLKQMTIWFLNSHCAMLCLLAKLILADLIWDYSIYCKHFVRNCGFTYSNQIQCIQPNKISHEKLSGVKITYFPFWISLHVKIRYQLLEIYWSVQLTCWQILNERRIYISKEIAKVSHLCLGRKLYYRLPKI